MKTDVPLCRRCCFCIPLRYGLLVWGYLALLPNTLLLISDGYEFYYITKISRYYIVFELILFLVTFLAKVIEFALTLLLIIASHKKDTHLLKIYYTYGLLAIGLNTLLITTKFVLDFITYRGYHFLIWRYLLVYLVAGLVFIGLQLYIIAMVRSEILKLENSSKFEFRNMAAEAECAYYGPNEGRIDQDSPQTGAQVTIYNEGTKNDNANYGQSCTSHQKEDSHGTASNIVKTNNNTNVLHNSGLSAVINKTVGYGKVVNEE